MHTYNDAQGLPPGRVAPLSSADLVRLMIIYNSDERRYLDDDCGKEDDNYDSGVDDEGGLFPII